MKRIAPFILPLALLVVAGTIARSEDNPITAPQISADQSDSAVQAATERGSRSARKDIEHHHPRILYYGKPWSEEKPLVDDRTGLPVQILAGCEITPVFAAEVAAYNSTMIANAGQPKIQAPGLASFISATPFGYPADPKTFTPAIWKQLAYVQPGVSREELAKHLLMNGGVVDDRYIITLDGAPGEVPRALLIHIIFRPAAMDEATFQDEKKRAHWHQEHPQSQPFDRGDVVVTFDKPYWGSYGWD